MSESVQVDIKTEKLIAQQQYLLTTIGDIEIPRRYFACRHCKAKAVPFDL